MSDEKKIQVVFEPGCFDSFEGTQEELDALMAEIEAAVASGELQESSQELTLDEFAELNAEQQVQILRHMAADMGIDLDDIDLGEFGDLSDIQLPPRTLQ